VLFYTFVKWTR